MQTRVSLPIAFAFLFIGLPAFAQSNVFITLNADCDHQCIDFCELLHAGSNRRRRRRAD